jgi:hypothetical protein
VKGELQGDHVCFDRDGGKDFFWRLPDMSEWGLKGWRLPTLVAPLRLQAGQGVARGLARESGTLKRRPKRADGVATVQRRAHLLG